MSIIKRQAWRTSRVIAHNGGPISRILYSMASLYTRTYNNLNYDMSTNGELKTVFDVGANKGEYTTACLSRFPDAKIHAFEIVPATFQKLLTNTVSPRVQLNNFGLSNSQGTFEINYNPDDDGSSSLIEGSNIHAGSWEKVRVNVVTGDHYCFEKDITSIDLLKVDVEGAENFVFEGFSKTFEQRHISSVQFEFGMVNIYSKFLLKDFWDLFTRYDFVLGPIMPRGVDFKEYNTRDENFQGPPNFFAVHKSKPKLIDAVRRRK